MLKLTTRQLAKQKKIIPEITINCVYKEDEYAMKFPKEPHVKIKDMLTAFCNDKLKKKEADYRDFEVLYNNYYCKYDALATNIIDEQDTTQKFKIIAEELKILNFLDRVKEKSIARVEKREDYIKRKSYLEFLINEVNSEEKMNEISKLKLRNTNFPTLFNSIEHLTNNPTHLSLAINNALESINDNNSNLILDNEYTLKPLEGKEKTPNIVLRSKDESFVLPITIFPREQVRNRVESIGSGASQKGK